METTFWGKGTPAETTISAQEKKEGEAREPFESLTGRRIEKRRGTDEVSGNRPALL